MAELSLSREGYTSYMGISKDLRVRQGDDVVLECSASSSEEPKYFWFKEVRCVLVFVSPAFILLPSSGFVNYLSSFQRVQGFVSFPCHLFDPLLRRSALHVSDWLA